jgi:hypothetical protein
MLPTTGPGSAFTALLALGPLLAAAHLLLPLGFRVRPTMVRGRLLAYAAVWALTCAAALAFPVLLRKSSRELGRSGDGSGSHLYVIAMAAVVLAASALTAVRVIRAARTEARLRPLAGRLLAAARPVHAALAPHLPDSGESVAARAYLADAQAVLATGHGRLALRYLADALYCAGEAAGHGAADRAAEQVAALESLRRQVSQAAEGAGLFDDSHRLHPHASMI